MGLLVLILISVLQFEAGVSVEHISLYYRPGDEAILPCASLSSSDRTCSIVNWFYNRDPSQTIFEVQNGNIEKSSVRAARLSLDTDCSLVINTITAEDVGRYTCRQGRNTRSDVSTYLSVLTVSPSPPDADPKRDGNVTLECSLLRYSALGRCPQNSIRWVDETGTVLLGEGVGYKLIRQRTCVSVLTVKHQSGHNRRYTCQFVDKENIVKIEADSTPVSTDPTDWSPLSYIMFTLRVAVLILMIVITVLVIRHRGNENSLEGNHVHKDGDNMTVNYENVENRSTAHTLH